MISNNNPQNRQLFAILYRKSTLYICIVFMEIIITTNMP